MFFLGIRAPICFAAAVRIAQKARRGENRRHCCPRNGQLVWRDFPPETGPAIDPNSSAMPFAPSHPGIGDQFGGKSDAEKSPFGFGLDATLSAIVIDLDRVP